MEAAAAGVLSRWVLMRTHRGALVIRQSPWVTDCAAEAGAAEAAAARRTPSQAPVRTGGVQVAASE